MKVQILILKLIFLGALFIVSNQNLHLSDEVEREAFFNMYLPWLESLVNQGVEVTAYVVKFEWLPSKDAEPPKPIPLERQ